MFKFIGVILKDRPLKFYIVTAIVLVSIACLTRQEASTTIKGALLGSIISSGILIFERIVDAILLIRKYTKLVGKYSANSYAKDGMSSYELDNRVNGVAEIKYLGSSDFSIKLTEVNSNVWEGIMTMNLHNIGEIGWAYTFPENLRNSSGYKRAVVIDTSIPLKIYLFSEDNQGYGREVLTKSQTQ